MLVSAKVSENAAEDFYMLNKLRKLGPVLTPKGPYIILSADDPCEYLSVPEGVSKESLHFINR